MSCCMPAKAGCPCVRRLEGARGARVEFLCVNRDKGPGMPDVEAACLQGRWAQGRGAMGCGFGALRRPQRCLLNICRWREGLGASVSLLVAASSAAVTTEVLRGQRPRGPVAGESSPTGCLEHEVGLDHRRTAVRCSQTGCRTRGHRRSCLRHAHGVANFPRAGRAIHPERIVDLMHAEFSGSTRGAAVSVAVGRSARPGGIRYASGIGDVSGRNRVGAGDWRPRLAQRRPSDARCGRCRSSSIRESLTEPLLSPALRRSRHTHWEAGAVFPACSARIPPAIIAAIF